MTTSRRIRGAWRAVTNGRFVKQSATRNARVMGRAVKIAGSGVQPSSGATRQPRGDQPPPVAPRQLSRQESRRLFDERAQRFLGLSGDEFRRAYEAGQLDERDDNVLRVAMLLPFGR